MLWLIVVANNLRWIMLVGCITKFMLWFIVVANNLRWIMLVGCITK